ncbi:DUF2642 domain-containing protein [Niallia nealsonii]|uniref:DUF2642 domain-containing protein n=1 Tax=Niallia nealsonii TaxID=115979 RepID=A0A2N0Z559_9BACI|nr:DUF2642 domain-containing protein [Niallia nealsonii]PKG24651.1 DUF2642 domain-containing protein [Niallia nealsonii]
MDNFKSLIGEEVNIEISGRIFFSGILIDNGLDILVLFKDKKYLYIPLIHVHNIKKRIKNYAEQSLEAPKDTMLPFQNEAESISYRKILNNAKGQFVEIFVTGNKSIHGYITSVLNDYIVFYSPVFKTIFISMQHLKWLVPYTTNSTPYTLNNTNLPVVPASIPLARTFEEQLKKSIGQLLVFDLGDNPDKVGLVKNISNNIIEIANAEGLPIFWKLSHLKSVHLP